MTVHLATIERSTTAATDVLVVTGDVVDGVSLLDTWQQIVVCDFDNRPRRRKIVVQVMGE